MKRGWITWDERDLPADALGKRIARVRQLLGTYDLPALVVYTDVWRSNWGRYLSNFMPYWNRSLLIIPRERPPILLSALSPRVYPWIRSVSILDEIRPSPKLSESLLKLCAECSWKRLGILDLPNLPQQIYGPLKNSGISLASIPAADTMERTSDPHELSLWRKSISMARTILERELSAGTIETDFVLAGRLERAFRRAGMEDLLLLFSDGTGVPAPARGTRLRNVGSVAVAAEYRGCWVRLTRTLADPVRVKHAQEEFAEALKGLGRKKLEPTHVCVRNMSGAYPYEYVDSATGLKEGLILSADVRVLIDGAQLFYGDTCRLGENGAELL